MSTSKMEGICLDWSTIAIEEDSDYFRPLKKPP